MLTRARRKSPAGTARAARHVPTRRAWMLGLQALTPGCAAAPRAQVQEADAMLAEQQRAFSALPSMQALTG
jgi:hypothetical protein